MPVFFFANEGVSRDFISSRGLPPVKAEWSLSEGCPSFRPLPTAPLSVDFPLRRDYRAASCCPGRGPVTLPFLGCTFFCTALAADSMSPSPFCCNTGGTNAPLEDRRLFFYDHFSSSPLPRSPVSLFSYPILFSSAWRPLFKQVLTVSFPLLVLPDAAGFLAPNPRIDFLLRMLCFLMSISPSPADLFSFFPSPPG